MTWRRCVERGICGLLVSLWASSLIGQTRPRLIVVVVVDQMREDYLERFAPYENGGFHDLLMEGADFTNANYQHLPTETCVGHAALLSGRNPDHTGIVGNNWYDSGAGKMEYCVEDANAPLIEGGAGASPRNFLGQNFSDWLRASYPGARVYSISLKDRAAVLLGGHHPDGAFWYSHKTGQFTTSRYYADRLPQWVQEFNAAKPAEHYAGKIWMPLFDKNSPAYHRDTVAGHFPHPMPSRTGPDLYNAVYGSPFGDELLETFAEATVSANHLGDNGRAAVPDLLTISFSSNDAVGHAYGPDSPEIADEQIRLDRSVGRLIAFLDKRLGKKNVLWVLSADHGSEPTPEAEKELRHNAAAQRIPFSEALQATEAQLNSIFHLDGKPGWFSASADAMLYFNRAMLAKHHIALDEARHALCTQVHGVPGISGFYDASQLGGISGWPGDLLRNSYFPERSGDVYYLTKEWTLFNSKPTGTSHGDPWPYDTHVPFVIAGWKIQPRRITRNVQVTDIAPTLADLMGVRWEPSEGIDGQSRKSLIRFAQK